MKLTKEDIHKISSKSDQQSFRKLFDIYHGRLITFAHYYVHAGNIAEEIVSDVFTAIWHHRKKLVKIEKIESYLYTATKNRCLTFIRDNLKHSIMVVEEHDPNVSLKNDNPENTYLTKEILSVFENSIKSLPPKCSVVYHMVKEENLSYKEVAETLCISVKAVEKHMGNALRIIRKDLHEYMHGNDVNLKNILPFIILLLATL